MCIYVCRGWTCTCAYMCVGGGRAHVYRCVQGWYITQAMGGLLSPSQRRASGITLSNSVTCRRARSSRQGGEKPQPLGGRQLLGWRCRKRFREFTWTYPQNRLSDREHGLVVAQAEGLGGGKPQEFGVSRCKLLSRGWINSQVLLQSTGLQLNSLWQIIRDRTWKRICMCVYTYLYIYVCEMPCCTQKLTQHCKSTIFNKERVSVSKADTWGLGGELWWS